MNAVWLWLGRIWSAGFLLIIAGIVYGLIWDWRQNRRVARSHVGQWVSPEGAKAEWRSDCDEFDCHCDPGLHARQGCEDCTALIARLQDLVTAESCWLLPTAEDVA